MMEYSRKKKVIYQPLLEELKRQIEEGKLRAGDPLMSDRKLALQFGISRVSARKAIKELVNIGYIYSVPAKGTFVAKKFKKVMPDYNSKAHTIGYIFWGVQESDIHDPFFSSLIKGVESECRINNYNLMVSAYDQGNRKRINIPAMIKFKKVDGVLLEGGTSEVYHAIEKICPVVVISNFRKSSPQIEYPDTDFVGEDNVNAIIQSIGYLVELGHKKIGYISGTFIHSSFFERFEGYRLAMNLYNLEYNENWTSIADSGYDAMEKILDLSDKPTAVIACNDYFALSAFKSIKKRGLKIPDDISVIGFDNLQESSHSDPPLTSVSSSTSEIGRVSVRRLLEKMAGKDNPALWVTIKSDLIIRRSCGPAKN